MYGIYIMRHSLQNGLEQAKNHIADSAQIPKDVSMGMPILTITGDSELCVENYRRILEYTSERIRIKTRTGYIKIDGNRLTIIYYSNDDMKIIGKIGTIEYQ